MLDGLEPVKLDMTSRCDRCGAQAYIEATLPSSLKLLFCMHHGRELEASLAGAGASLRRWELSKELVAQGAVVGV